jgi:co-chaperonin GroES (HSP10)
MKPTSNRLLVRVEVEVLREGEKGNTVLKAEVLDVGPEVKQAKKGGMVVFAPYGFDELMEKGEKLVIIGEDLILATYEKSITKTNK